MVPRAVATPAIIPQQCIKTVVKNTFLELEEDAISPQLKRFSTAPCDYIRRLLDDDSAETEVGSINDFDSPVASSDASEGELELRRALTDACLAELDGCDG